MKFLFVDATHHAWGMEQHLVALATGLAGEGHDVYAIVQRGSPVHTLLESTTVRVIPIRIRGGADPRVIVAILRTVIADRPDWMLANQSRLYWPLCVLGLLTGVRVALFRHLLRVKKWSTRTLLPHLVDRFIVVSRYARDVLTAAGAPAHRVSYLYNPIDMRRFKPDPALRQQVRASLGIADESILVGFAGRISGAKGACVLRDAMCDAMDRMPAITMLWMGEGHERENTQHLAATRGHGSRHIFVGWRADVERYFAAIDVLVAPCVESETFGRVSAEAQACCVPVVASALGGLFETLLPGSTGILVMPGDKTALMEAIMALATDANLRKQMGEAGRRFVMKNFAAPVICREFVASMKTLDRKYMAAIDAVAKSPERI